ncbi:S41 family peptidase [Dermatophilus congolensis]|uniref:S41 family peptidase n=1 Tax=Dermatophilus congolensis TaxID=1863 RepID=UPI001AAF75EF|nr:S41 family peptidase [Dermatophilus congolensis]MBO3143750.1 hypothetical protein [Dermatophilus congolensis]MBO3152741.1 hypothetical protein [Dermatophilus congolensis]MBO3160248.1 hypothetical protein [Dermatophilus congolensis]MBO3164026.1 hypothetical protein [Dermatophilus congolensis]MBO3177571.1 hypothetical protein [Dermatophilus congolensis]
MTAPTSRRYITTLVVLAMLNIAVGGGLSWSITSREGVRIIPPTATEYAADALTHMDHGLGARGPAWTATRAQALRTTSGKNNYEQTWSALEDATRTAGRGKGTFTPATTITPRTDPTGPMPTVNSEKGITTLTLPRVPSNAPPHNQKYADQLASNIDVTRPRTTCGWIVDLRELNNSDAHPVLAGLTPLFPNGPLMTLTDNQGTTTTAAIEGGTLTMNGSWRFGTYRAYPKTHAPVAVLLSPRTSGPGEIATVALTGRPNTRTFGAPTSGNATMDKTWQLYDGSRLTLPTHQATSIHGAPAIGSITPDSPTPTDQTEERARTWLTHQCR